MNKIVCIKALKDEHGEIYGYRLKDYQHNIKDVKLESIKRALEQNTIQIENIRLDENNDLEYTEIKSAYIDRNMIELINKPKALEFESYNLETDNIIQKANMIGADIKLSDDVVVLEDSDRLRVVSKYQLSVNDCVGLFANTFFTHIDLSDVDVSKVNNMREMFKRCKAQSLDLSKIDTSNVRDMSSMFKGCTFETLDLRSFDTLKVKHMERMFSECRIGTLDLSSFKAIFVDTLDMFSRSDINNVYVDKFSNIYGMPFNMFNSYYGKAPRGGELNIYFNVDDAYKDIVDKPGIDIKQLSHILNAYQNDMQSVLKSGAKLHVRNKE